MMKYKNVINLFACFFCVALMLFTSSCDKTQTYAEMLEIEAESMQKFLESDGRFTSSLPATFEEILVSGTRNKVSNQVPFYELENDVYMQVVDKGNGTPLKEGDRVYFRFLRINLNTWSAAPYEIEMFDPVSGGVGNYYYDNIDKFFFDFAPNYSVSMSQYYTYGMGIEYPLPHLSDNAKVYLVLPSKVGFSESVASVTPYLYYIEYNKAKN